jgi:hypothetical protein
MLRHHQQHAITHYCRCHRQGDAGIAASRLYQRIAGLDLPSFLRAGEHRQGGAVFHRTGWVITLKLDENLIARVPGEALEFHQRRVADEVFQGLVHDRRLRKTRPDYGTRAGKSRVEDRKRAAQRRRRS